jgi:hypothetical protein
MEKGFTDRRCCTFFNLITKPKVAGGNRFELLFLFVLFSFSVCAAEKNVSSLKWKTFYFSFSPSLEKKSVLNMELNERFCFMFDEVKCRISCGMFVN